MSTYSIKKINNGEYKEINRKFVLNVPKYCGNRSTLYFDVDGEELPVLFDIDVFYSMMVSQIQTGLMESMSYKDGIISICVKDGNILKNYDYDFQWEQFGMNTMYQSAADELKSIIYKIVSIYNEDPNHSLTTSQKYVRMLLDIMDGDRLPKIESNEELLRIFEVYHANKAEILEILLDNVIFYDDNNNVLEYGDFLKERKLRAIKYDVLNQMEIKMLMFAVQNDALELYQNYVNNTFIPRVELEYKYVDENGNEVEPPVEDVEAGTVISMGKEIVVSTAKSLKKSITKGLDTLGSKIQEKRRTRR